MRPEPKMLRIGRNRHTGLWQARCAPCRLTLGGTFSATVFADARHHVLTGQHALQTALWLWQAGGDRR